MKSGYNPQERIHSIMNKIDTELSVMKKVDDPTTQKSIDEDSKMMNSYKERAVKAYKQKKLFTTHGNNITIRRALVRRGWVEKCAPTRLPKLEKLSYIRLLRGARRGNEYETAILSKLVQSYPPNFIWQPKHLTDQYIDANPFRNRVRRTRCMDFSTKIGLIACLEKSHWNTIKDVSEAAYMPSYKLSTKEDELHFLDDFRITQCISILSFFVESKDPSDLFDKFGVVSTSIIEFPVKIIENYVKKLQKEDVETNNRNDDLSQWESFNANIKLVLKEGAKIIGSLADCLPFLTKAQQALEKSGKFKPFQFSYGFRNLWILKPGFQCRGQGIVIMDNFEGIVNYAANKSKSSYVVQKYIERPLLIYKTKFDIRQYMLLTVLDVISIWMYTDCYLRFSSHEFSLGDLRESIHLTNNSIQKKYKNTEQDARLPAHNMWSLSEFQNFLHKNGAEGAWSEKIYPGFKKNLISVVLSSLEETELTPNSFEIYGCDFMLDERLNPFLIEINSTPDMSPSTPVTAKICPSALEDLIKVVIDHSKNSNVSTGQFELIYKIECPRSCSNSNDLVVEGTVKQLHIPVSNSKSRKIKRICKRKIIKKKNFAVQ